MLVLELGTVLCLAFQGRNEKSECACGERELPCHDSTLAYIRKMAVLSLGLSPYFANSPANRSYIFPYIEQPHPLVLMSTRLVDSFSRHCRFMPTVSNYPPVEHYSWSRNKP